MPVRTYTKGEMVVIEDPHGRCVILYVEDDDQGRRQREKRWTTEDAKALAKEIKKLMEGPRS